MNPIVSALQSSLFLVICILTSAGCGIEILNEQVSIIHVLLTIFLWLVYADGRRGIVNAKNLRCISGTVFASYVVNYIRFALIAAAGVLIGLFTFLKGSSDIWSLLLDKLEIDFIPKILITASNLLITILGVFIAVICVGVAIVGIVLNRIGYRKLHKFAQMIYLSADSEEPIFYHAFQVRIWTMVFAVLYYISAAFSFVRLDLAQSAGNVIFATVFLISSIWIGKFFTKKREANDII